MFKKQKQVEHYSTRENRAMRLSGFQKLLLLKQPIRDIEVRLDSVHCFAILSNASEVVLGLLQFWWVSTS